MIIYTSYFGKLRRISDCFPIAICRYPPKYFMGEHLKELAPNNSTLYRYKNDREWTFHEFAECYCAETLSRLNASEVYESIMALSGSSIPVLCCYEKDPTQCHRSVIGAWLRLAGFSVMEV